MLGALRVRIKTEVHFSFAFSDKLVTFFLFFFFSVNSVFFFFFPKKTGVRNVKLDFLGKINFRSLFYLACKALS